MSVRQARLTCKSKTRSGPPHSRDQESSSCLHNGLGKWSMLIEPRWKRIQLEGSDKTCFMMSAHADTPSVDCMTSGNLARGPTKKHLGHYYGAFFIHPRQELIRSSAPSDTFILHPFQYTSLELALKAIL